MHPVVITISSAVTKTPLRARRSAIFSPEGVIAIRSVISQSDIWLFTESRVERPLEGLLWDTVHRRQSGCQINQVRIAGLSHKLQQAGPWGERVRRVHRAKVLPAIENLQDCLKTTLLECWSVGVLECWSGGVLECWSVGVLECWSVGGLEWWRVGGWSDGVVEWWSGGVMECWSAGVLECWSGGVLECWSAGELECWSAGVLECWRVGGLEWLGVGGWSDGVVVVEWWSAVSRRASQVKGIFLGLLPATWVALAFCKS